MIILHTTHCPMCGVLEKKLKMDNVNFVEDESLESFARLGKTSAPVLEIEETGQILDFKEALDWLKENGGK